MLLTPKNWQDFLAGGTPTDAAAFRDLETRMGAYANYRANYRPAHLVRFVDPLAGSDSDDGLSPNSAYLTIAHAYADLLSVATANYSGAQGGVQLGIGRINLLPGLTTMTAGVDMDYKYPIELVGHRSGMLNHSMSTSASVIAMNSTTAQWFFRAKGTNVGYGWLFKDIHFVVDQTAVTGNVALTSILNFDAIDDWDVDRCSADTLDNATNLAIPLVKHDNSLAPGTGDAAWFRLRNCRYSRVALYSGQGSGGNFNRFRIHDNRGFYGGTLPHCRFAGDTHGGLVDGNNFEGSAVACEMGPTGTKTQTTFINNSGEDPSAGTPANPFYLFSGACSQALIIGGTCSVPSGGSGGVWIEYRHASAYNNLAIGPWDSTGVAGEKRKIVDSSTSNFNRLINFNSGPLLRVKSGSSGPAFSDSDFAPAPMDGSTGIAVNTTSGEQKLWMRANGAWLPISTLGANGNAGGTSTQTPSGGATTLVIAHGLGATPARFNVVAANLNASAAGQFYVTADSTNLTIHFTTSLAAISYAFAWMAGR